MNSRKAIGTLPLLLLFCLVVGAVLARGTPIISRWIIGGGGSKSTGGNVSLSSALGQAVAGRRKSGDIDLQAGFWSGGRLGGSSEVYLPAVLRNYCDPYEPNDSRSAAWGPLTSGQTIGDAQICQGDSRDIYYFDAGGSVGVTISLRNMAAGADFALYLWDETGSVPLAESRHGAGADEQIVYTLPGAGRYYVDVYAWSGTGSYTLQTSGW